MPVRDGLFVIIQRHIQKYGGWSVVLAVSIFVLQVMLLTNLWLNTYHPLPWHDEWDTVELLRQISNDPKKLQPWVALHNEHRLVLPRVIFALDFWIFDGLSLFTFLVLGLLACSVVIMFVRECRRVEANIQVRNLVSVAIASILLCGQQASNFLWAFQVQWFLVHFFTVASVVSVAAAASAHSAGCLRKSARLVILSLILTAGANFSTVSGNLSWISTGLVAFLLRDRLPRWTISAVCVVALISIGVYFTDFHLSGTGVGSIRALQSDPLQGVGFILAFLGVPFAPFGKLAAIFAGIVFLIGAIVLIGKFFLTGFVSKTRADAVSSSLIVFVLCVGVVTTIGRFMFGVDGALESRFASVVSIGWAALTLAAFSFFSSKEVSQGSLMRVRFLTFFSIFAAVIFCSVGIAGFLKTPYDYSPLIQLKRSATTVIISGHSDIAALERVGFPAPNAAESSPVISFLKKSHRSVFSDYSSSRSVSPPSILYKNDEIHSALWPEETKIMLNVDSEPPVKRLMGLSVAESFGRWSNSKLVMIQFDKQLPREFQVEFVIGGYGGNIGDSARVFVGPVEKNLMIKGDIQHFNNASLEFKNVGETDTIYIVVPKPIVPNSVDRSSLDTRPLGIALQSLTIRPLTD